MIQNPKQLNLYPLTDGMLCRNRLTGEYLRLIGSKNGKAQIEFGKVFVFPDGTREFLFDDRAPINRPLARLWRYYEPA